MEGCMLLEGNVHIHGIHKRITADLFVKVHTCVFKTAIQPMALGAALEPITFLSIDQQLRQTDNETLPGLD